MIRDRRDAPSEKSLENRVEPDVDPMPLQLPQQAPAAERFAVNEHAVAIENNQIVGGSGSGGDCIHDLKLVGALTVVARAVRQSTSIRSYAQVLSNHSIETSVARVNRLQVERKFLAREIDITRQDQGR
jgi:hypothetical protein